MTKLDHTEIKGRFSGGVTPLGPMGPKASGLADTMASLVTAPVKAVDRALSSRHEHDFSSMIQSPTGMG